MILRRSAAFSPAMLIQRYLVLVACLWASTVAVAQDSTFNPSYPRLAAGQIGGWGTYSEARIQAIAKHDIAVIGGHRQWTGGGLDLATLPGHIKSYNPNIKVFKYTNPPETYNQEPTWSFVWNKLNKEKGKNGRGDWWLRTADGSQITGFSSSQRRINFTPEVSPDLNGLRWPEWFARYWNAAPSDSGEWVNSSGRGLREGKWDGIYEDNQYISYAFGVTADYNSDGTNDDKSSDYVRSLVMQGHTTYIAEWKRLQPNWYFAANMSSQAGATQESVPESFQGINDGGWIEEATRAETWGGWQEMMARYRRVLGYLRGPKIAMFHNNLDNLRSHYSSAGFSDYRWNRYGLASCLMDNGYYMVTNDNAYRDQPWFDEFDIDLGRAIDPPQTAAWSQGVYRREFERGLVLVNPKGNGRQTVNIGSGWARFMGNQDPVHNNGQGASSVTLEPQDGILLVRIGAAARPEPPQSMSVQ